MHIVSIVVKREFGKTSKSLKTLWKWLFAKFSSHYTGWPTKMSLFFFGNTFSKNNESFKIFSPQLLEVYRIILVETTLESTMFYYTFSIINTMSIPCTALLYDSTAETRTLKLSTTLLNISCGIRLIYLQKRNQTDSTRNAL